MNVFDRRGSETNFRFATDLGEHVSLPLVSVIIVNYNYGRFLRVAAQSVVNQSYPNVECIIVDNASTDDSPAVLSALEEDFPHLKVVRRSDNGWQSRASLDGLAASEGAYVVFMDADDILLPDALDAHVFAHLSLRRHVGFTSGDMLQMAGGQVVVASGRDLGQRVVEAQKGPATSLRAYRHPDASWPNDMLVRQLEGKIHVVPALGGKWVWSPTSGNCFRRDAILLFVNEDSLPSLRTGTDFYLAHGIGALCGSALIDRPTFVYRIHGRNIFSRSAQLDHVSCGGLGTEGDNNALASRLLIDHLIQHAERFVTEQWLARFFVRILCVLDCPDPDPGLPRYARRSHVARRLVEHADRVVRTIGGKEALRLACLTLAPPWHVVSAILRAR